MSVSIDKDTLKNICKIGQNEKCCRYLLCGSNGFECGKHSELKEALDNRVNLNLMVAKGDNCKGLK